MMTNTNNAAADNATAAAFEAAVLDMYDAAREKGASVTEASRALVRFMGRKYDREMARIVVLVLAKAAAGEGAFAAAAAYTEAYERTA